MFEQPLTSNANTVPSTQRRQSFLDAPQIQRRGCQPPSRPQLVRTSGASLSASLASCRATPEEGSLETPAASAVPLTVTMPPCENSLTYLIPSTSLIPLTSSICLESAHRSLPCTLSKGAASFFELFELFDPFEFFDPFNFFELPHFYSPITPLDALGARGAPSNGRAIRAPRDRIHHTSVSLPDDRDHTFLMPVQRHNFSPFHPAPASVLQPRSATSEIANHSKTPSSSLLEPHSARLIPAFQHPSQNPKTIGAPELARRCDPGSGVPISKIGLPIPLDAQ